MYFRKTVIISCFLVLCAALAGCSSDGDTSSKYDGSVSAQTVSAANEASAAESVTDPKTGGTIMDTGIFTVTAPEGWGLVPFPDTLKDYDGKVNPYSVYAIKGGTESTDVLRYPYIWITYYPPEKTFVLSKSFYDDTVDIPAFEIGSRSWEGFSYNSMGVPGLTVAASEGEGKWGVSMVLENGDSKISLGDDDVKEILAGISLDKKD